MSGPPRAYLLVACGAVALLIVMGAFDWFGIRQEGALDPVTLAPAGPQEGGAGNAYELLDWVDLVLAATASAALLATAIEPRLQAGLPAGIRLGLAALAVLSVILIVVSIVSPPDLEVGPPPISSGRIVPETLRVSDIEGASVIIESGAWAGLACALVLAAGTVLAAVIAPRRQAD